MLVRIRQLFIHDMCVKGSPFTAISTEFRRHLCGHVLRGLLPPPSMATQQYSLRRRPHDRQMPDHTGHLADKNFLIRMLYKDSY